MPVSHPAHQTVFDRALKRSHDVHFWHSKDVIDTWPAYKLLGLARACSKRFYQAGVRPGQRVAICLPTSPGKLAAILGAWGCGATVVVLPYAIQAQTLTNAEAARLGRLGDMLHLVEPALLVHDEHIPYTSAALVGRRISSKAIQELANGLHPDERSELPFFPAKPRPQDPALIQLTSGSTGLPKGVLLTHAQIASNCGGIGERVLMDTQDHVVSWLPIHHDMGFAAVSLSIWADASLTLIAPERFTRAPTTWLEAMSHQRGTVSPNPAFAYTLLGKYAARLKNMEIDLSSWRYAWAGAEPVFDKHLKAFYEAMRPFGLRDTVLKPAFGMAEAVVAVTCDLPGRPYLTLHIDAALFRSSKKIKVMPPDAEGALSFVSNGPALSNMAVKIVDEQGIDLGESSEGRVFISGASVAGGYLNGVDSENFHEGGWFDTGDLGFIVDGELYISGRAKDLIIRGGVNASPQHVEWAIEQLMELRPGQVAAFSVIDPRSSKEEVIVLVGHRIAADRTSELISGIARVVAEQAGVQVDRVVFTTSSKIPKTTSGKVQRSRARAMYLNREFDQTEMES